MEASCIRCSWLRLMGIRVAEEIAHVNSDPPRCVSIEMNEFVAACRVKAINVVWGERNTKAEGGGE